MPYRYLPSRAEEKRRKRRKQKVVLYLKEPKARGMPMNLPVETVEEGVVYHDYLKKTNRPGPTKVQAQGAAKIKPTVICLSVTGQRAMWITKRP